MNSLKFNYFIANFVSILKVGIIRKLRFIKLLKLNIYLRLLRILYKQGIIRTFFVKNNKISVYFKYYKGRNICSKLSIISTPRNRIYWTLGKLSKNYNNYNFSGFYIISSPKGLITTDYCLMKRHISGEVLIKVEI